MKTADLQVFGLKSKYWTETNHKTHLNFDISSKTGAGRLLVCSLREYQKNKKIKNRSFENLTVSDGK